MTNIGTYCRIEWRTGAEQVAVQTRCEGVNCVDVELCGPSGAKDTFLWRGDYFQVAEVRSTAIAFSKGLENGMEGVAAVLRLLKGGWTILFVRVTNIGDVLLWAARDPLGRRSLIGAPSHCFHAVQRHVVGSEPFRISIGTYFDELEEIVRIPCLNRRRTGSSQLISNLDQSELKPGIVHTIFSSRSFFLCSFSPFFSSDFVDHPLFVTEVSDAVVAHFVSLLERAMESLLPVEVSSVAVLFSGGVDSLLLALVLDRILPAEVSLELVNVAFSTTEDGFDSPDRWAAVNSLWEATRTSSNRRWALVTVNVSSSDLRNHQKRILEVVAPKGTLMEFNIAAAVYFGALGIGERVKMDDLSDWQFNAGADLSYSRVPHVRYVQQFETLARDAVKPSALESDGTVQYSFNVLFSGMGPDELLGGYRRHKSAYIREGWMGIARILREEMEGMWSKTLGVLDRAGSTSGRLLLLPYLDDRLVEWIQTLPLSCRCRPDVEGASDKVLVRRAVALEACPVSAGLAKRAIQFGTRADKLMRTFLNDSNM